LKSELPEVADKGRMITLEEIMNNEQTTVTNEEDDYYE
jgi:hypothetical protein